ncbi:MAG TPA: hypothetical protein VEV62_14370 [Parafilimonas sp.]|jgi:hypothetical protein|nr:hypothetical protein [Parafilimonas sp.]
MTDFKNLNQAVSSVIEFYRSNGYEETVLTALKEMLVKHIQHRNNYDELAIFLDEKLQANGVHYDSANIYLLMMNALLKASEYNNEKSF